MKNIKAETRKKLMEKSIEWWNNPDNKEKIKIRNQKISNSQKGKKMSEEQRKNLSISLIGNKRALGCKHSKKSIDRARNKVIGNKSSKETRELLSLRRKEEWENGVRKGGWKHTKATIDKMKLSAKKGPENNFYGKDFSGSNSPRWIKDRSLLKTSRKEAFDVRYREWIHRVRKRDRNQCRLKNQDCKGRIETHHILSWKNYPKLRYDINNGITLCQAHHPRKRAEEKRLILLFQELVSVSNEII